MNMNRYNKCLRKKQYVFVEDAYDVISKLNDQTLTVYKCKYCNMYHIGHDIKTKKIINGVNCKYINRFKTKSTAIQFKNMLKSKLNFPVIMLSPKENVRTEYELWLQIN